MDRLLLIFGVFFLVVSGCRKPVETTDPETSNTVSDEVSPTPSEHQTSSSSFTSGGLQENQGISGSELLKVRSDQLVSSQDGAVVLYNGNLFTGVANSFYPNGEQATEIFYVDGMRDGIETRWHDNGVKRFQGRFHKNQLIGVFEEWYSNGKKRSEALWQDGKRVSFREWSETGEILREQ
jgi:antitoxin component YwqK of YwqJK toxin-antitoxin module